jgi:hypothetical protein
MKKMKMCPLHWTVSKMLSKYGAIMISIITIILGEIQEAIQIHQDLPAMDMGVMVMVDMVVVKMANMVIVMLVAMVEVTATDDKPENTTGTTAAVYQTNLMTEEK